MNPPPAPWRSVRSGEAQWMICQAASPSPTASSRDVSWPQHHASWGKWGPARWHLHPFPNRQQSLQPLASPHMHKNQWGIHHWAAVCWWLCLSCPRRGSRTAHCQPLFWCSQELWPHHQPEEDWGVVPTFPMRGIQSSSHHHRWHQCKCCGTLHVSGLHHLQWCHSQQGSWQRLVQSQQFLWKTVK